MSRFVGLDLGLKGKHRAVVLDGTERRGKPFSFEMNLEGIQTLLSRARDGAHGEISLVMEPTGLAWLTVAAHAKAAGFRVYLAKTQKLSDLRKFYRKHTKTDVIDAEAAARLPQMDPSGVHELAVPTAEQTTFRRLVKRRERMSSEVCNHKRRVHASLVPVNPGLMAAFGGEAFGKAKKDFLRKYVDPVKVIKLGKERLEAFLAKRSRGSHDRDLVDRVLAACQSAVECNAELRRTSRMPLDYEAIREEIDDEIDEIERKEAKIRKLDRKIKEIYHRIDPDRTLEQLHGVGPTIAAAVEALVGNIERFPNSKKFVSYCGLCPRKKQSGSSDPAMPMTKTGQRVLKKYLYLAADIARRGDPDFASYYARRSAAGVHHNGIIISLAAKLARRIHALLTRREAVRRARAEGDTSMPSARYILRDHEGNELTKEEARALILGKFTRSLVDPSPQLREPRVQDMAEIPAGSDVSGRPMDATSSSAEPPRDQLSPAELLEQHFPGLLRNA